MYYVVGDSNGNITERYDTDFALYAIPANAVEVTESQWNDSMQNPGKYIVQNGLLALTPSPADAELLAQAKAAKVAELEQACVNAINAVYTNLAITDFNTAITNYRTQLGNLKGQVVNCQTPDDVTKISWS